MVIEAIETALNSMDPSYCQLSQILYFQSEIDQYLAKEKYLERPFAYEFYHQFRKLIDEGRLDLGGSVIQAEVDKRYQHLAGLGKIPDFIIHTPNSTEKNLAIVEFKLASNHGKPLVDDLKKLVSFKRVEVVGYKYLVAVVIGNSTELKLAWAKVNELTTAEGEQLSVIGYNVAERKTEKRTILFEPNCAI